MELKEWIFNWILIISIYLSPNVTADKTIQRVAYCYGDSSAGYNLVNVACTEGGIFIHDVIAASKPTSLGCPADDHAYQPAEQAKCCTYNATDCMKSFAGSWSNFLNCNGKRTCSGIPVIRDEPICPGGLFPRFSNHMVLEYYCMPPGYNYGPCNTTADCRDPAATCNKTYCACQDGYTTFFAFDDCWKDGSLNGSCKIVGCQDANTVCDHNTSRCVCDVGYVAYNGSCVKGGHNLGFCVDTEDCTDPLALCDHSLCICERGYIAFEEYDKCWKDGGLNGTCNINVACHDSNTVCNTSTNRCQCVTGYAPTNGTCYKDGDLNGYCEGNAQCKDPFAICTKQRCTCVIGYSDINGTCKKDGELGGHCVNQSSCVTANATCKSGICACVVSYTAIDGKCNKDWDIDGNCNITSSTKCTDIHAQCVTSATNPTLTVCKCQSGYTNVAGTCKEDRHLGGTCSANSTCLDSNTNCSSSGLCVCVNGSIEVGPICILDGDLHGFCELSSQCVDDYTTCINKRCECIHGYTDIKGICKKDGELGGKCEVRVDCIVANTVCETGICVCAKNYTDIDGLCRKDWELEGKCNSSTAKNCTDSHALCTALSTNQSITVCKCQAGFTNIGGVCKEERHLGGRCSSVNTCLESNTNCSEHGICVCVAGFSEVNSVCKQDGEDGGVCFPAGPLQRCSDKNAECVTDTKNECGGVKCSPGLCKCKTGYSIGVDGTCIKDGDVGGKCTIDADCRDSNANCDDQTFFCVCSNGYSHFNGVCVRDGNPGGNCLPGGVCKDAHSICVNGTCICNDARNYILKNGICQRDENYVNGNCALNTCNDPNAVCISAKCTCSTGYTQANGVCKQGVNIPPSVSSCNGSSPYNQLSPDCAVGLVPLILQTYQRVKPAVENCPQEMNNFSLLDFTKCCSYDGNDCRIGGNDPDTCTPSDLIGSYTTYTVVEYICVLNGSYININESNDVSNNPVYVTTPDGLTGNGNKTCSVTASCKTDIYVYLEYMKFLEGNTCNASALTIVEATQTNIFTCSYNGYSRPQPIYTTGNGFFIFTLTNPKEGGRFVLKIEANKTTANIDVACGDKKVSVGPSSFRSCDPEAGLLGGKCSSSVLCVSANTICKNGICICNDGYKEENGNCVSSVVEDPTNEVALLAIVIPVAILIGLAVASIVFWLLRDRIRKSCFPKQDPSVAGIKQVETGPSPMNTKYTGKGVPSDVKIPTAMPPPWQNTGWTPMNEKFRGNLPNDLKAPKSLPPLRHVLSSSMNNKYNGKVPVDSSSPVIMTDYLIKEQLEADKLKNINKGSEDGSQKTNESGKSKKKHKKFKKGAFALMAKRGFELPPVFQKQTPNGVFRPNENFYTNGGPSTVSQSSVHPPPNLPPLRGNGYAPPMPWQTPGQSLDLRSSLRSNAPPLSRRTSVLDIISVDDPTNVEHADLEVEI